ncbi:unnamed protein product [Rhizophagus irregularis]|nr:unnamed protein product [Rhizophagus irregularis]CAB5392233.1 unnamed protein product [Rhizophagus irregularis]
MQKYSPAAITYISLNIINLSLSTFIIIKLCISPNYFTKYTQFQLFIASWGYTIGCLLTIIKYGDDIINRAFETHQISICVIQQMISLFFFYPLHIFPVILGFYIWNTIENQNIKIEKKFFWPFSILIWCFTICYNVFSLADGYQKDIRVTPLLCKPPNSNLHKIIYLIIISPLFCIALIFIYFTAIILWKRWQQYSIRKNRWNALRLGHVLCLFICDVIYTILLGTSLLSRIMSQYIKKSENSEVNKIVIEDFVQPFIPKKLLIQSEYRDDNFLYARSSIISSSSEINQISIAVQQVTTITSHTTLEISSMDTTNKNTNEIRGIE